MKYILKKKTLKVLMEEVFDLRHYICIIRNLKQLIANISLCAVGIFIIFVLACEKISFLM